MHGPCELVWCAWPGARVVVRLASSGTRRRAMFAVVAVLIAINRTHRLDTCSVGGICQISFFFDNICQISWPSRPV